MTDIADIEQRLRARLDPLAFPPRADARVRGDHDLNPDWDWVPPEMRSAAVLAPIIKRRDGWTMLFTQRTEETPAHPGQISFPGGRVQPEDGAPLQTALRETEEEIGLSRGFIEPVGAWDLYQTGSGFRITPIVGLVEPGFELTLCAREVASVFEVPLAYLFDPANHIKNGAMWNGRERYYWSITHQDKNIWGVTAGMLHALYERLYL